MYMIWKLEKIKVSNLKIPKIINPILITGLPGIGNVGKITVDFMIEELNAQPIYTFFSYYMPNSVFVNQDNLVIMPEIKLYLAKVGSGKFSKLTKNSDRHKNKHKQKNVYSDLLFLAGDFQPTDEFASYALVDEVLDLFEKYKGKEIITIGGIGLTEIPKKPKIYCTGNSSEIVEKYVEGVNVDKNLYGNVGPIMGVTGILVGMSKRRNIPAVSLLGETYGHPLYLGINTSREIITILNSKLGLEISLNKLDAQIKEIESSIMKKTKEINEMSKHGHKFHDLDTSYIG